MSWAYHKRCPFVVSCHGNTQHLGQEYVFNITEINYKQLTTYHNPVYAWKGTSVPDFAVNLNFPPKTQPPIGTCGAGLLLGASLSVLKLRGELMWIRMGHWVLSLISATGQHFPLVHTIHERCATNAQRKLTQALIAWQGPTCTPKSAVMSFFGGWQSYHWAYSCNSGSWALMLSQFLDLI